MFQWATLVAQMVKNLPALREVVYSLSRVQLLQTHGL